MEIRRPKNQQDLKILQCWFRARLLLAAIIIPLIVLFLTYLSYLLVTGCLEVRSYNNTLEDIPTELKNVRTVLDGFAANIILLNSGFILFTTHNIPLLFSSIKMECISSEAHGPRDNIVWWGIQDYIIRNNSDVKYLRRRLKGFRYWKSKFPKTMVFSSLLFWTILGLIVLCVTLCVTESPTVMMLLNIPVVALMLYLLRLLTDDTLHLLRFYISSYKNILPQTADSENKDDGLAIEYSCEAGVLDRADITNDLVSDNGNGFGYMKISESVDMHRLFACDTLDDNPEDMVLGIDDVDTSDNWFADDELMNEMNEKTE